MESVIQWLVDAWSIRKDTAKTNRPFAAKPCDICSVAAVTSQLESNIRVLLHLFGITGKL